MTRVGWWWLGVSLRFALLDVACVDSGVRSEKMQGTIAYTAFAVLTRIWKTQSKILWFKLNNLYIFVSISPVSQWTSSVSSLLASKFTWASSAGWLFTIDIKMVVIREISCKIRLPWIIVLFHSPSKSSEYEVEIDNFGLLIRESVNCEMHEYTSLVTEWADCELRLQNSQFS